MLADPPEWALEAGLPRPDEGERFEVYVARLGLDVEPLLEELVERTACLANLRLRTTLTRHLPVAWERYKKERRAEWST